MTGGISGSISVSWHPKCQQSHHSTQVSIMSRVATKPSPDKPRNAWSEDKDGKYSEKEMENLLQKPALQLGPQEDW